MPQRRAVMAIGAAPLLLLLAACGGGGGGGTPVASTPAPVPTPTPTPVPTPVPVNYDTAEYRRSNGPVQAQALAAYNAGASGAGVIAGIIDSGIDAASPEFAGRISAQSGDFAAGRGIQDEGGHGTSIASVLLGARNDSGTHGVAPAATLLVLRTDTPGSCTAPTAAADGCSHSDNAIARGLDRATSAGARVVNISLGGSPANGTLRAAIDRATASGVIIVFSAGNDGVTNPAAAANPDTLAQIAREGIAHGLVLIAGATDATQTLADFSNRAGNSAAYYVTALGVRVRGIDQTGAIFLFSGTSYSTPIVAGAVALLAQAFPALSPAQLVDLLTRTATDLGAAGTDAVYGHGEVNLARAFAPVGSLALAGSAIPVSPVDNASLGSAMGDAGQTGLAATVRDYYGRDYAVDLAPTLARALQPSRLAGALGGGTRSLTATFGPAAFSLALADDAAERLRLTPADRVSARALAGMVAARLGRGTALAFGFGMGSAALAHSLDGDSAPAFVAAGRSDAGIDHAAGATLAMRQQAGRFGLTVASETGDTRVATSGGALDAPARRYGYSSSTFAVDCRFGPLRATLLLGRLDETGTVLGSELGAALGGGGAATWFAESGARLDLGNWHAGAALRRGWTQLAGNAARASSRLASRALTLDFERRGVLGASDSLALRWAEPLRVTGGGLDLTALGTRLDLAPHGHERDLEAVYARPAGAGALTLNGYWRQQPGNIAAAPDDLGIALRYALAF